MPVSSIVKDPENLTMTIVADFPVPVRRLWDAYADPRQLEKFWGPPDYPTTFTRHGLYPGGRSEYYMTGPDGSRSFFVWDFLAVENGRSFEVQDGWADENGTPTAEMPSMRMVFEFSQTPEGSRLTTTTTFPTLEAMEQVVEMGIEEGTKAAMAQIDDVLADLQSFAAGRAVDVQVLSDTQIRCSRIIAGSVEQVWQAQHDPELLKRWLLGPDGWTMTEATVANAVGDTYRYAWEPADGVEGEPFAFTGELKESAPPHREVSTESMEGMDGPPSVNEQTLKPVDGGTLLTLVITYDSKDLRDIVLGTGMADGMEASYSRLEREVLAA